MAQRPPLLRRVAAALPGLALLLIFPAWPGNGAPSCGVDTPCRIATGEYRIRVPEGWNERTPLGAIVFLHGWRGSARTELRNPAWTQLANQLNVAVVLPEGKDGTWSYPGAPDALRDDFAFFEDLVSDLTRRFPIRREHLMAAGFSIGGSMVWNLACHRGELFSGYAPVAGAFWEPVPESCPSPVPDLYHVHGTEDRTVPLTGRPIGERWHQSTVADSLAVWQRKAGLPVVFPKTAPAQGLGCQRQETGDAVLEVCLHAGGHSLRAAWIARAWRALVHDLQQDRQNDTQDAP
ncbi:polyhydroxybutyrate depolymerase [Stappia taiwanensis]|uniref:Polyhydroxybutyrate depolymerase n=1 Tax=Stappia taiwanensis TaxID=992267 RepID=A0A838XZZ2_9HYPH|nr:alpha/beta hydrolase-fold protein [Stappia taiwanensis]MBA4612574.1 polyhydroxybutyrate depolymerase [Stappia taiwanensis]GGE89393.1 hypothetical protein GCM10007285_16080 [Stappia taiwanensis]